MSTTSINERSRSSSTYRRFALDDHETRCCINERSNVELSDAILRWYIAGMYIAGQYFVGLGHYLFTY